MINKGNRMKENSRNSPVKIYRKGISLCKMFEMFPDNLEAETEELTNEYENYRRPKRIVGIFVRNHRLEFRAECRKFGFMDIKKRLMRVQGGGRYDAHHNYSLER